MELDLGAFRNIHVDAASKTMTVGGAVRFGEVYDPLYEAGFEVRMSPLPAAAPASYADFSPATGSCSCVNMVGATLGGGVSPQQGLYGMILDSLLEVRMVTGTGTIVTASESKNPDLFWGIRGAGFNFGIVLSATYRIYELPNKGQVMNADFVFPANSSRRHWELLRSFEKDQPAGLSLVSTVTYQEQYGGVRFASRLSESGGRLTYIAPDQYHLQRPVRGLAGRRQGAYPSLHRERTHRPEHHRTPSKQGHCIGLFRRRCRSVCQGKSA